MPIDIDGGLLKAVREALGTLTAKETVEAALRAVVAARSPSS